MKKYITIIFDVLDEFPLIYFFLGLMIGMGLFLQILITTVNQLGWTTCQ